MSAPTGVGTGCTAEGSTSSFEIEGMTNGGMNIESPPFRTSPETRNRDLVLVRVRTGDVHVYHTMFFIQVR